MKTAEAAESAVSVDLASEIGRALVEDLSSV